MSTSHPRNDAAATSTMPEPQPWRTREDAKGWRVVGVGQRHPRWLEFAIAAIAYRHDPLGIVSATTPKDVYRPQGRAIAELLRGMNPAATSCEDVRRLMHATFARLCNEQSAGDEAVYGPMAEEILVAWCQHAYRAA
ncbi:MAG: hypothetical protein HY332_10805 [Chloroflexi bacterium]|nr:hypothetical protein [Chloroflexota bacterium]